MEIPLEEGKSVINLSSGAWFLRFRGTSMGKLMTDLLF